MFICVIMKKKRNNRSKVYYFVRLYGEKSKIGVSELNTFGRPFFAMPSAVEVVI